MKSNTKSVIDRIKEAATFQQVEHELRKFGTFDYRFASPATKRKAHRAAKESITYGFITGDK